MPASAIPATIATGVTVVALGGVCYSGVKGFFDLMSYLSPREVGERLSQYDRDTTTST